MQGRVHKEPARPAARPVAGLGSRSELIAVASVELGRGWAITTIAICAC